MTIDWMEKATRLFLFLMANSNIIARFVPTHSKQNDLLQNNSIQMFLEIKISSIKTVYTSEYCYSPQKRHYQSDFTSIQNYYICSNMNSEVPDSVDGQQMEASHFEKMQPVDFNLTYEQFLIIQHHLPKKYALIQHKNIKKGVVVASAVKLGPEDTQNLSRVSGNVENTEEIEGRTKRIRIKKVDKFLQQQPQKMRKSAPMEVPVEDELAQCTYILNQLKKNKNALPFLVPVDPKRDGVLNYFDIIKQPMDLSTVQTNLNNGVYRSAAEFHAHINKIWSNSYNYNEKGSIVNKMTIDLEKYYKSLLNSDAYKKSIKGDKSKSRVDKEKQKNEMTEQRDQRKKGQYFASKDFVYDSMND